LVCKKGKKSLRRMKKEVHKDVDISIKRGREKERKREREKERKREREKEEREKERKRERVRHCLPLSATALHNCIMLMFSFLSISIYNPSPIHLLIFLSVNL